MANPQIRAMLAEAVRLHQAGRLDQAAPLYQQVLTLEPDNADALNLLGLAAQQTGQHQAAIALLRKAVAADSRQPAIHFNLGLALQTAGALDEAEASFRRALVLKPNESDTLCNLANVQAGLGRLEEAQASYRKALSLEPGNAPALNNLGTVLWNLERKAEAEELYRKALAAMPDYADALVNLGNAQREKGDLAGAVDSFRRALALTPDGAVAHNSLGLALWSLGKRDEAEACYRKALALEPNLASALANLGIALWEKGQLDEADAIYRKALALTPGDTDMINNFAALAMARGKAGEVLEALRHSLALKETRGAKKLFVELAENAVWGGDSAEIRALMVRAFLEPWDRPGKLSRSAAALIKLGAVTGPIVERAEKAWPARLSLAELTGGAGPLAADALLMALLTSAPNTELGLERFLTLLRAALLEADEPATELRAALAQQCFINEYVFLPDGEELARAQKQRERVEAALASGAAIAPKDLLAVAAYFPLHALAQGERLLQRDWPAALGAVLTQQIREPLEEARLKQEIARLTPIEDDISVLVREQYEENPYPRWVRVASGQHDNIVSFLSGKYPHAAFERQTGRVMQDFLVAGCGTGQHSISTALKFGGGKMLAVDLSLSSLAYAKRKSAELGLGIEYGQADILELPKLGRQFDVIESLGVLHHMKEPFAGWQALLSCLRPNGFMWLGFYSQTARRNIVEARARIAEHGLTGSADDIRAFRQELAEGGGDYASLFKSEDFYSVSAARDLMFHAQEHRMSLPQLGEFLAENNLTLLGFELDEAVLSAYRRRFPDDPGAVNLAHWHDFEQDNPGIFAGMYVFWIQKT